ncbi:TPA: pilus assembly protein, partial [Escherichia coli]|nr:pilus assembly protein [Escherichia coli]
ACRSRADDRMPPGSREPKRAQQKTARNGDSVTEISRLFLAYSHTLPSDRKAGPAAPQALHPAFPAGVSLPGVFERADRRPPPPALYHLFLLP